jgi:ribose transport system substrate-binding protein
MRTSRGRLLRWTTALAAAALTLTACAGTQPPATGGQTADGYRFGVFFTGPSGYTGAIVDAAQAYAAERGATVQEFSANYDPTVQLQQCQDAVASGRFDGLLFNPVTSTTLAPCVSAAQAAGVAVASIDSPLGPDPDATAAQLPGITAQIVLPISDDGAAAADMVVQACAGKNPCRVAYLLGEPSITYSADRARAVQERLAASPTIQIVATGIAGFGQPDLGATATTNALTAHPDLDVIVNDDDTSATGIEKALADAGRLGQVQIISGGGSSEGFAAIKDGRWFGTVLYLPQSATRKAMELMLDVKAGTPAPSTDLLLADLSPTRALVVTKDTVGQLTAEWSATGATG